MYLFESFFVGLYCVALYSIGSIYPIHYILLLFITGFVKHYLGYFILHDYYCKYGEACAQLYNERTENKYILVESLLEGVIFVIIGFILFKWVSNRIYAIFILGFILHAINEMIGLHTYFCENRCN